MKTLLLSGAFALSLTAFAQSGPATNRPVPPAPPRPDAPGAPINPQQNTPAATAAQPAESAAPRRELVFAEADTDGDKRVSLHEFTTFVEARMDTRSTQPVSEATIDRFRQLDQDNDAFVSEAEATVQQQPPAQVDPGTPPPPPRRR